MMAVVSADVSVEGLRRWRSSPPAFRSAGLAVGSRSALLVPQDAITTRAGLDFVTVDAPATRRTGCDVWGQQHELDGKR